MPAEPVRIPALDPATFTQEQKDIVGPWSVLNFSRVLAQHPALYRVYVPFVEKVIRFTHLPPRDREVLAIHTLALCNDHYESAHHVDIARKCGMSDDLIHAAQAGSGPALSAFDRLLVAAAGELVHEHRIRDATWASLAKRYSTVELMEVVGLVGCYTVMAMVTRSFGMQLEAAEETANDLLNLRDYT